MMPLSQDHWSTYADPIGLSFASFEGDFLRATRACDNIIDERPGLGKKKDLNFVLNVVHSVICSEWASA